MAFDQKDWERRMKTAHGQEELTALIMELPDSTSEEGHGSSTTEPATASIPLTSNTPIEKTLDG